jgi:hypothetical protein
MGRSVKPIQPVKNSDRFFECKPIGEEPELNKNGFWDKKDHWIKNGKKDKHTSSIRPAKR